MTSAREARTHTIHVLLFSISFASFRFVVLGMTEPSNGNGAKPAYSDFRFFNNIIRIDEWPSMEWKIRFDIDYLACSVVRNNMRLDLIVCRSTCTQQAARPFISIKQWNGTERKWSGQRPDKAIDSQMLNDSVALIIFGFLFVLILNFMDLKEFCVGISLSVLLLQNANTTYNHIPRSLTVAQLVLTSFHFFIFPDSIEQFCLFIFFFVFFFFYSNVLAWVCFVFERTHGHTDTNIVMDNIF